MHDVLHAIFQPRHASWAALAGLAMLAGLTSSARADAPTLDELLDLEPTQHDAPPADAPPQQSEEPPPAQRDAASEQRPEGLDVEEDIRRLLRGEAVADAFEQAVQQMDAVARRLGGELDAGLATQREQESILAKLEQVIEAAQQQQMNPQSQGGSGSSGQQQPREQDAGAQDLAQQGRDGQAGQAQAEASADTGENTGESSAGQVRDPEQADGPLEELRREWGQLPPRLRDEISEGLQERFSPAYRSMTEAYYRRLAEEGDE